MDLSNSKNLKVTACFEGILNLERLDLTGCINLLHVDPSIELLTELEFLSLQNCSSLVIIDFGTTTELWSLKFLRLSDCTKLESTPNFSRLIFLKYLDMDRCASLFTINESIGDLTNLKFLSMRDCTNLVEIPIMFNKMASLITLDLCGCSKLNKLPLGWISPSMQSLIYLDLSFCHISEVSYAIGELMCLERLNLQGNNFTTTPSILSSLHNLSYLNLSHCHRLQTLPELSIPTQSGPSSDSAGRYFKTTSGSRNHRSGLYIFDSPNCMDFMSYLGNAYFINFLIIWLQRLFEEPRHFRCGFDIVIPWHEETNGSGGNPTIQSWFKHRFNGGSKIRIEHLDKHINWVGFLFYVAFELNNHPALSCSSHQSLSSLLPPFYLSFESEYTEERFDMPLNLERNMVDGKSYLWTIYISREHCHFVKTGAHISFKARQGLITKEWGLHIVTKEDSEESQMDLSLQIIDNAKESNSNSNSNSNFEPKIQLPYNWLVSDEDKVETKEAKGKETNLFNIGLFTERPQ